MHNSQYTNPWSKKEMKLLKRDYGKISNSELKKLFPNRSKASLAVKARRLKLALPNHQWTIREETRLRKVYPFLPQKQIIKLFPGIPWSCIKRKAVDMKVKRINIELPYAFDVSQLLKETLLTYYWLGFLLADGHFSSNGLYLLVSNLDKSHVKKFVKYMKGKESSIQPATENRCRVAILNKRILPIIKEKYDIADRKTYYPPTIEVFKKLSDNQFLALFAGFMDGDGCIFKRKRGVGVTLSIVLHKNWLIILDYFRIRLEKILDQPLAPAWLYRETCRFLIHSFPTIKSLKRRVSKLGVPTLSRKWSKVNTRTKNGREKTIIRHQRILKLFNSGISIEKISKKLKMDRSTIIYILNRIKPNWKL